MAWFVNTYPPDSILRIASFFLLFFLTTLLISIFFLKNVRQGLFVSLGLTVFFLLRMLNLREPLYPLLLLAALISLEVLFRTK